ncbi:hypothetical protein Plano_1485 [Planococcus sp. PAMC 21323]|nr:hypothetical protein Plano_1485 [Planococcus sp. PAMC 21323]
MFKMLPSISLVSKQIGFPLNFTTYMTEVKNYRIMPGKFDKLFT